MNRRTITLDEACRVLSVQLPVVETELKSRFRELAFKAHPDQGGSSDQFRVLKQAYDVIAATHMVLLTDTERAQSGIERTVDGVPLTELGLGLGPNVNGRDCETCERKGYKAVHEQRYVRCVTCDGMCYVYRCRDCATTGQFTLRSGRKVPCRRCNAKGFIPASPTGNFNRRYDSPLFYMRPRGAEYCPKCLGTGRTGVQTNVVSYYKCGSCEGTGEIKIYNPVILKGTMGGRRR